MLRLASADRDDKPRLIKAAAQSGAEGEKKAEPAKKATAAKPETKLASLDETKKPASDSQTKKADRAEPTAKVVKKAESKTADKADTGAKPAKKTSVKTAGSKGPTRNPGQQEGIRRSRRAVNSLAANPARLKTPAPRQEGLALTYHRLMLMMLVFGGITLLIVGRLLFLTIFTDRASSGTAVSSLIPARADIVDRKGAPLARTMNAWTIGVFPGKLIGNKDDLAARLSELMPEKSAAEFRRILNSPKRFVYLKRRAMPELVSAVNALGEPGLDFSREPERLYPNGVMAAHIIGYTNLDGKGEAGMERALDARLSDPARRGEPLQLSLDARVQHALEAELHAAMTKFSAIGAAGIIMDIHTGEVMAMTSLPELNPNAPGKGSMEARFNRATLGVYELGSTFKPFTVAMGMDDGHVKSLGQMYPCPGGLTAGRFTINDTHPFGRPCSVAEIMQESSNIGTAQIATQVGGVRQKEYLRKMAFLEPVSIELKERGRTLSPGNNWGEVSTMTVGFGHGIAVTPLHLASGYATLLNGGVWRPATLLKHGPGNPVPAGRRVFSEDTSYKMRALLGWS
jgi:cell division protein FtsI (penicillin-binding protein 3)